MQDKLKIYCQERGITLEELAKMSNISVPMIYKINKGDNVSVDLINKIYSATKERFGVGLIAEQYLNIYIDKNANQ